MGFTARFLFVAAVLAPVCLCKRASSGVMELRTMLRQDDPTALRYIMGDSELACWISTCDGDVDAACARVRAKAAWRKTVGRVSMADCARMLDSDGYSICLAGLRDRRGASIARRRRVAAWILRQRSLATRG